MNNPIKNVPFSRLGNKTLDIKFFKEYLPYNDVEIVIEPFCGSFAVSRICYNDDKYIKHLNDFDVNIYNLLNNIDDYITIHKKYTEILKNHVKNNDLTLKFCDNGLKAIKNEISNIPIHGKSLVDIFFIRGMMVKTNNIDNYDNLKLFLNKVILSNQDYKEILYKYQENEKAFLFLDPPYYMTNNNQYIPQNINDDSSDILVDIAEFLNDPKTKCKVMLITNKNKITEYFYKQFIKKTYTKKYQISKKNAEHLIITNY